MDQTSQWLDIRRAAAYLGFSTSHLRVLAREGKVKSVRPCRRYRFKREWLDAYMTGGVPMEEAGQRTPRMKKDPAIKIVDGRVRIDMDVIDKSVRREAARTKSIR